LEFDFAESPFKLNALWCALDFLWWHIWCNHC